MRITFREAGKIDLPIKRSAIISAQIFQQEPAQGELGNFRCQRVFNLLTGLKARQIQREQSGKNRVVHRWIDSRSHVRHHQFFHTAWKLKRELHRCFPAHRMADDERAFNFVRDEKIFHVHRHQRIIHFVIVRRLAMIALIHGENMEPVRQPLRDIMPVVRLPEQAVQQHERLALAELFEMKLHCPGVFNRQTRRAQCLK
jgi:hypothetical protein